MNVHPVEEWVKKAEDNFISALDLSRRRKNRVPDVICNQCQQSAEKYLKALLVRHEVSIPKIHDLEDLEDLIAPAEPDVRLIDAYLDTLNPYSVDIRYPGSAATDNDATEAIKAMKEVRKFVRAKLGLKAK